MSRFVLVALIGCAHADSARELAAEANEIAAAYRPLVDVAVVRIDRLKRELRGNLPGWENALRIAELANDELGLPPFTQAQPPGPAWKPSPASLLGIAPYVQARAGALVRDDNTDELRRLIHDERVRYPMGLALVEDRISEVEAWVATQR